MLTEQISSTSWLAEWRNDLLRGSSSDPLVDLSGHLMKLIELHDISENQVYLPWDAKTKRLLAEQQDFFKQSGVNVLCLVHEVLVWSDGNKQFETPIFLSEVRFKIDKIEQCVNLEINDEQLLNPFLEKTFEQKFDKSFRDWLDKNSMPETWSRKTVRYLGNFHYHRFVLLKDYDEYQNNLSLSECVLGIFLQDRAPEISPINKPSFAAIYPMDQSQQNVFDEVLAGNHLVVEGPPGSGKSQIISNLLFNAALQQKHVVLCSEKHTALQVIAAKLAAKGLELFCQDVANDDRSQSSFVRGLERTWNFLEEHAAKQKTGTSQQSTYLENRAALDLKMDRLRLFPKLEGPLVEPNFLLTAYPDWENYQGYREQLFELNNRYVLLKEKPLSKSAFVYLKSFVFESDKSVRDFVNELENHFESWRICSKANDNLPMQSQAEMEQMHRVLIHAQILTQPIFTQNPDLFTQNSKSFKKFQAVYHKYLVSTQALDFHEKQEGFKWRQPWSKEELVEARHCLSQKSFWSRTFRRWKQRFIESYQPEVFTRDLAIRAIDGCLEVHATMFEHQQCLKAFHRLGVMHPEIDIPLVLQLQRNASQDADGLAKTQKEYSPALLARMLKHHLRIQEIYRFLNHYFSGIATLDLPKLFEQILSDSDFIFGQRAALQKLIYCEPSLVKFLPEVQDFHQLDGVVLWGSIQQFKTRNPELYFYTGRDLSADIDALILEEEAHFAEQVSRFIQLQVKQFMDFHHLLSSNSAKLSAEEKELKAKLKLGRSTLIKEFNKSRQHKTMRDLLAGDTAPWIRLLKPILLLPPLVISKVLPNESEYVDLMIFDEASQIPFSHAIPAMFRAKQLAIFGDSQQLSPSAYFLQGCAHRADLLTESRHYLPSASLNFHYRSRHESLIAYSNRYFYDNRLQVLPSRTDDEKDGVFSHFVQNGLYDSGQNEREAHALINFLNKNFNNFSSSESIGIVAFSEKQMQIIHKQLGELANQKILESIDSERITITTVEKVQGDEFDVLLISMAYAKDASGAFALRMGPLNQEGGEKRLNVLFSRARRALHFFHSVQYADFPASENLGVQALKNFLLMHELPQNQYLNNTERVKTMDSLTLLDPFYALDALDQLLTIKRHAGLSGLKVNIRFLKD